ncbi:MAG: alkaline phosphatase family protein, partial [Acidimicrobiales bacterium]
ENESLQAALADPSVAALAHRYAYDSESYAATHPSLPNYLALTAGGTFGISSDCLGCFIRSSNLGTELTKRGVSWDAFFQGVSSRCYLGTSYGLYAAKHNPFRYFDDIRSSRRLCSHLRPYSELGPLLAGPVSAVPSFLWVTPDVCDDGHSCSEAVAGRWLAGFVAEVTRSRAWTRGGVLFATWDEGSFSDTSSITPAGRVLSSGGGGRILTLVVTPRLRAGTVLRRPLNHFGLLATIEENFSLPLLHGARAWRHHTLFKFRD